MYIFFEFGHLNLSIIITHLRIASSLIEKKIKIGHIVKVYGSIMETYSAVMHMNFFLVLFVLYSIHWKQFKPRVKNFQIEVVNCKFTSSKKIWKYVSGQILMKHKLTIQWVKQNPITINLYLFHFSLVDLNNNNNKKETHC